MRLTEEQAREHMEVISKLTTESLTKIINQVWKMIGQEARVIILVGNDINKVFHSVSNATEEDYKKLLEHALVADQESTVESSAVIIDVETGKEVKPQ